MKMGEKLRNRGSVLSLQSKIRKPNVMGRKTSPKTFGGRMHTKNTATSLEDRVMQKIVSRKYPEGRSDATN